jgi:hypothetical protein
MKSMKSLAAVAAVAAALAACGGQEQGIAAGAQSQDLNAAPQIVEPNNRGSPVEGGKQVFIAGFNIDPAATATYGGVPAVNVSYVPPSGASLGGLMTWTPANPEGFVDIVVTNPDGQSATWSGFHYGPPPSIASFGPTDVHVGDQVTISGANFGVDGLAIQPAVGTAIAPIVSSSLTQLVITVPKVNQGKYQIVVSNADSQYAVSTMTLRVR